MIELVDTHSHIQSAGTHSGERITRQKWEKLPDSTGDTLLQAAVDEGVTRVLCVGCDLEDSRLAADFVKDRQHCWASIGIHPHEAQHYASNRGRLKEFSELTARPKVVAIGECGLDYYYEHSPKEKQVPVLEFQLELALQHNVPVIFHVRDAFEDFWPIFNNFPGIRGVLHSFTDSQKNLELALEKGLYIGVNGIATFAKDQAQLEVYRAIPQKSLLLETDAPFLTPTPYRGSINEPRRVRRVAEFVSELRNESLEVLARATTANARALFGI